MRSTDAGVFVEDKLFATLDTRTRRWRLNGGGQVLLSDTVGFIRKSPAPLVASFKATLEEARSGRPAAPCGRRPRSFRKRKCGSEPVEERPRGSSDSADQPTILVLNKADRVPTVRFSTCSRPHHHDPITISAAQRDGIDRLEQAVREALHEEVPQR